ncbi:MAG: hypothetical protein EA394_06605 [Bacteroidia bacterium]|nr:MAG: hypothetical protein EA394_06605 [Bacteroidia bacterium]
MDLIKPETNVAYMCYKYNDKICCLVQILNRQHNGLAILLRGNHLKCHATHSNPSAEIAGYATAKSTFLGDIPISYIGKSLLVLKDYLNDNSSVLSTERINQNFKQKLFYKRIKKTCKDRLLYNVNAN